MPRLELLTIRFINEKYRKTNYSTNYRDAQPHAKPQRR